MTDQLHPLALNALNVMAARVHKANAKWWIDLTKPRKCKHCDVSSDAVLAVEQGPTPITMLCIGGAPHEFEYPPLKRNVGELLMLVVSELAEALEGDRKNLQDDKLPHRKMFEVELADAVIRILDIAGGFQLDIGGAFEEKMVYNAQRADHSIAHRLSDGGKKY